MDNILLGILSQGSLGRLYHCDDDSDKNYELNPASLATINTVSSPFLLPSGIGGINERLYHCDYDTDKNYELNPDSLATINTVSSPSAMPYGIGGIKN
jgi:hypothetical protein